MPISRELDKEYVVHIYNEMEYILSYLKKMK